MLDSLIIFLVNSIQWIATFLIMALLIGAGFDNISGKGVVSKVVGAFLCVAAVALLVYRLGVL